MVEKEEGAVGSRAPAALNLVRGAGGFPELQRACVSCAYAVQRPALT